MGNIVQLLRLSYPRQLGGDELRSERERERESPSPANSQFQLPTHGFACNQRYDNLKQKSLAW